MYKNAPHTIPLHLRYVKIFRSVQVFISNFLLNLPMSSIKNGKDLAFPAIIQHMHVCCQKNKHYIYVNCFIYSLYAGALQDQFNWSINIMSFCHSFIKRVHRIYFKVFGIHQTDKIFKNLLTLIFKSLDQENAWNT